MLYQLSYASTSKPDEVITQAIKLQAPQESKHDLCHNDFWLPAQPQLYTNWMQIYTQKVA
jgi:hypothetical protein